MYDINFQNNEIIFNQQILEQVINMYQVRLIRFGGAMIYNHRIYLTHDN